MAFKRYYPSRDTTIANFDYGDFHEIVVITGSNMGASEILNLYQTSFAGMKKYIYENGLYLSSNLQPNGAYFAVTASGYPYSWIDISGSEYFSGTVYRIFTSASAKVLIDFDDIAIPSGYDCEVWLKMFDAQSDETLPYGYTAIVKSMEQDWTEGMGQDLSTYTDMGPANWASATLNSQWIDITGTDSASFYFKTGHEDLEVFLSGPLSSSCPGYEISIDPIFSGSDLYIKKFHSRHTFFPTKRPYLEVRWADATGVLSTSSLFMVTEPGPWSGSFVELMAGSTGTLSGVFIDVTNSLKDPTGSLAFTLYDLKSVYDSSETVTLHLNVRPKDWNQATVTTASSAMTGTVLTNAYYRVVDVGTDEVLVPFGTGTVEYTKLSYDDSGNYFWFDMSSIPTATLLRFDFMYQIGTQKTVVSSGDFIFRVK